jgi:hypothetical protein
MAGAKSAVVHSSRRSVGTTLSELRLQLLGEIDALALRSAEHQRRIDEREHAGHTDAEEGNGSLAASDPPSPTAAAPRDPAG